MGSFDKTMEAVVDAKNNLATKQEVENHLKRYLNVAKKLIDDTKLANDPTQDNFIKCLIILSVVCIVTGNGSDMVISVYPGYMSIKAVLSQDTEDDQRWLKYWVLISLFLIIQIPADWILAWAPGFSVVKIMFLLWCMSPIQDNGSVVLFRTIVIPYYQQYSSHIDKIMSEAASSAGGIIKNAVVNLESDKQE